MLPDDKPHRMRLLTTGSILSIDVDSGGRRIATGGADKKVKLWELRQVLANKSTEDSLRPELLATISDHVKSVNVVRWSRRGDRLASASDDKAVLVYEREPPVSPSGLAEVFADKKAMELPPNEKWAVMLRLEGHSLFVMDLAWSPDDKLLASCSLDKSVCVWSTASGEIEARLTEHGGSVKGVAWDPSGRYLASQADNGSVIVWATATWTAVTCVEAPFQGADASTTFSRLTWSPCAGFLTGVRALKKEYHTAVVLARGDWLRECDFGGHTAPVGIVRFNHFMFRRGFGNSQSSSRSGLSRGLLSGRRQPFNCLAVGSDDGWISVWTTDRAEPLVTDRCFISSVSDLSWSPDGYTLLCCSYGSTIMAWHFTEEQLGIPLSHDEMQSVIEKRCQVDDLTVVAEQKVVEKEPEISSSKSGAVRANHKASRMKDPPPPLDASLLRRRMKKTWSGHFAADDLSTGGSGRFSGPLLAPSVAAIIKEDRKSGPRSRSTGDQPLPENAEVPRPDSFGPAGSLQPDLKAHFLNHERFKIRGSPVTPPSGQSAASNRPSRNLPDEAEEDDASKPGDMVDLEPEAVRVMVEDLRSKLGTLEGELNDILEVQKAKSGEVEILLTEEKARTSNLAQELEAERTQAVRLRAELAEERQLVANLGRIHVAERLRAEGLARELEEEREKGKRVEALLTEEKEKKVMVETLQAELEALMLAEREKADTLERLLDVEKARGISLEDDLRIERERVWQLEATAADVREEKIVVEARLKEEREKLAARAKGDKEKLREEQTKWEIRIAEERASWEDKVAEVKRECEVKVAEVEGRLMEEEERMKVEGEKVRAEGERMKVEGEIMKLEAERMKEEVERMREEVRAQVERMREEEDERLKEMRKKLEDAEGQLKEETEKRIESVGKLQQQVKELEAILAEDAQEWVVGQKENEEEEEQEPGRKRRRGGLEEAEKGGGLMGGLGFWKTARAKIGAFKSESALDVSPAPRSDQRTWRMRRGRAASDGRALASGKGASKAKSTRLITESPSTIKTHQGNGLQDGGRYSPRTAKSEGDGSGSAPEQHGQEEPMNHIPTSTQADDATTTIESDDTDMRADLASGSHDDLILSENGEPENHEVPAGSEDDNSKQPKLQVSVATNTEKSAKSQQKAQKSESVPFRTSRRDVKGLKARLLLLGLSIPAKSPSNFTGKWR